MRSDILKKKIIIIFSLIIFTFTVSAISYSLIYCVKNNPESIEKNIKSFPNDNKSKVKNVTIQQTALINNKMYVLYTFNNKLAYAELTKGINHNYKINYLEYSSDAMLSEIIKTNKGKYFICFGKNIQLNIHHLKVIVNKNQYIYIIKNKKYYIEYHTVPPSTPVLTTLIYCRLFDIYNKDITPSIINNK